MPRSRPPRKERTSARADRPPSRQDRIRRSAEALFGQKITEVSAPGGSGRASLRFHFGGDTVIGTLRRDFRRTHLEAHVLRTLEPHCDDIPRCLGVDGVILFQSDVGARRLNLALHEADAGQRETLIADAMAAILRIQRAAQRTSLPGMLPHLGNNPDWLRNLVDGADILVPFGGELPVSFDPAAALDRLTHRRLRFVKWDCRTGNAAIGPDGRLRWFDFEYAGLRHGAEDLAWLIADETVPVDGATLYEIARDALTGEDDIEDYMDYLAVYTVFHALKRLDLIISEARARGWLPARRILERDDVGVHPRFAAQLCRTGAQFAARAPLTAMLVDHFEAAAARFDRLLETGSA